MRQESTHRVNIDPYYKGSVFQRDQAYYSQMLTGTRRTTANLRGSQRQSSVQRSNLNEAPRSPSPPANINTYESTKQAVQYGRESAYLRNADFQRQNEYGHSRQANQLNQPYAEAIQTNRVLKQQLQMLVSGNTDFGHSENVIKLSHYSFNQSDLTKLKQQESEIRRLETLIDANQTRIQNYKKAGQELSQRMGNIQSIDKQIYKTLQGSVNRDKQLLERASTALARGQRREDIAKILQQIIG